MKKKKNSFLDIFGISDKAMKKRQERNRKRYKDKMLKRLDIDPKTHPLFINIPRISLPVNTKKIEKIIEEARKRDRRKYLKNVKKLLEDDNDFGQ